MKLNLFVDIFKVTINEIKECKQLSKSAAVRTEKVKYMAKNDSVNSRIIFLSD